MKPIKLIMNAFGCFHKETIIDFEKLNAAGIYLITGSTGSGKTTIFDAMVFSLYGEGSGTSRESKGFRSDYATKDERTYVEFTFEDNGVVYKINRSPSYTKEGQKTQKKEEVALYKNDDLVGEKVSVVNPMIIDIIGVTADQFRQTIMLAQGEFMKLILSSSKERQEILRKIFGTEVFQKYTEKLKSLKDTADKDFEVVSSLINNTLNSYPLDIDSYNNSLIDFNNIPLLLIDLDKIFKEKELLVKQLNDEILKLEEKKTSLNKELGEYKEVNLKFDKLNNKTIELNKEKELEVEINNLRLLVDKLVKVEDIKDLYTEYKRLGNEKSELNTSFIKLEEEYNVVLEEYNAYAENVNLIELDRESINQEKKYYNKILKELEVYGEINKLEKQINDNLVSINSYNTSNYDIQTTIDKLTIELNELKSYLDKEQEYSNKKADLLVEKKNLESIDKKIIEINKTLKKYNDEKKNYNKLFNDFNELKDIYVIAAKDYSKKEDIYFREIAGTLASKLEDDKPCPVCGSIHHPSPAVLSEEAISKEELDKLKEEVEGKRNKKDDVSSKLQTSKELINEYIKSLKEILDVESEDLFDDKLNELTISYESNMKKVIEELDIVEKYFNHLDEKKNKYNELSGNITSLNNDIAANKGSINKLNEINVDLNNQIVEQESNKQFDESPYEDIVLAEEQYKEDIEYRQKAIDEFDKGKIEADLAYSKKKAEYDANKSRLDELDNDYVKTERAYLDKLSNIELNEEDISNIDNLIKELLKLRTYESKIRDYDNKVIQLNKDIVELNNELDGKVKKDLSKLESDINELEESISSKRNIYNSEQSTADRISDVRNNLDKLFKEYGPKYKRKTNLDVLYSISSGKGQNKIAFETYVLTQYFENIINQANVRLIKMSGGKYRLDRQLDLTGRGNQGLDLEVFDFESGKSRAITTLSGGEKFKTALCLALGLADTIESSNGGLEISTLFIDEGFGNLDETSIREALKILQELRGNNKTIGIISHVALLEEMIPTKVMVSKDVDQSKIKIIC